MPPVRDRFCSSCGTEWPEPRVYPRTCANAACGMTLWANPIPVSIVLLPVRAPEGTGLLVVRRGIEPRKGFIALIGGFVEEDESWQAGGAREMFEEVGVTVDPAALRGLEFVSTEPRPNRILLFSEAPRADESSLGAFAPNPETAERGLVFGPDGLEDVFAFPLHVQAAKRWFERAGITGPHRYRGA